MLNGLEKAAFEGCIKSPIIKNSLGRSITLEHNCFLIRYANNFIIGLVNSTFEIRNIIVSNVENFLKIRGLNLN